MALDDILKKIVKVDFPADQYVAEEKPKTQIVIHHTVSGPGAENDIAYWRSTTDRIGTCVIIDNKGVPFQCFSSKYYAYHLGLKESHFKAQGLPYLRLDPTTIGVEIDAYGGLTKKDGKWLTVYGNEIPVARVQEYTTPFMGFCAYERYTVEQIETLRQLLLYWADRYGIPLDYHEDMWDVSKDALSGVPGIYTHVSYRGSSKSDCHPQPELITMLKGLK